MDLLGINQLCKSLSRVYWCYQVSSNGNGYSSRHFTACGSSPKNDRTPKSNMHVFGKTLYTRSHQGCISLASSGPQDDVPFAPSAAKSTIGNWRLRTLRSDVLVRTRRIHQTSTITQSWVGNWGNGARVETKFSLCVLNTAPCFSIIWGCVRLLSSRIFAASWTYGLFPLV